MFGLPTHLSLNIVERTYDQKMSTLAESGMNKREIDYFNENISDVESVDDLMDDHRLYSFVMKSFDLEGNIPYRAMMEQILSSDMEDSTSLANRLTDPRLRDLASEMGFMYEGSTNLNTVRPSWREDMVDRYLTVQLESNEGEANPNVEEALYFKRKAPEITNWYSVLGDQRLSKFMRTALMLPDQIAALDIDRQVELFQDKFDIENFSDPQEIDKLVTRYSALADTSGAGAGHSTNSGAGRALSMLSTNASMGLTSQIISIDPVYTQNFAKVMRY